MRVSRSLLASLLSFTSLSLSSFFFNHCSSAAFHYCLKSSRDATGRSVNKCAAAPVHAVARCLAMRSASQRPLVLLSSVSDRQSRHQTDLSIVYSGSVHEDFLLANINNLLLDTSCYEISSLNCSLVQGFPGCGLGPKSSCGLHSLKRSMSF